MAGKKDASASKRRGGDVAATGATAPKRTRIICDIAIPKIPKQQGTVLVCGQGDVGQLGLGEDRVEAKSATIVPDLAHETIVEICAGGMHSLCITQKGEVYSFGCNDHGALGRDTSVDGSEFTPGKISLPGKCVKVSAGDSHSACLLEDGRVFACGSFRDSHGDMGLTSNGPQILPIEILPGKKSCDIASGTDHLVILTCSGEIYSMGCGEQGQLGRVTLRAASGETRAGKLNLLKPGLIKMKNVSHVEKIWATRYCTFLKEFNKSKWYAFGLNNYKQLGAEKHHKSSTEADLVVFPKEIKLDDVKTITGGQHHTLILTNKYECYSIGNHDYGRLGLGNISEDAMEFSMVEFPVGKKIVEIACGEVQSFAITKDGELYSWGMGSNLQLGNGSEDDVWEPVSIKTKYTRDNTVIKVSSGGQHTLVLILNPISKGELEKKEQSKVAVAEKTKESVKVNGSGVPVNKKKDDIMMNSEPAKLADSEEVVPAVKRGGRKRK